MLIGIPRESNPARPSSPRPAQRRPSCRSSATTWSSSPEPARRRPAGRGVRRGRRPPSARPRRSGPPTSWSRSTRRPTDEIARLRRGAIVISLMAPARTPELVDAARRRPASPRWRWTPCRGSPARSRWTCCPRWRTSPATAPSSRPRTRSAASSPARSPRPARSPPAKVFVVGAGVAGLAALGAAGSMGAIVRAFDVRPEVAEQVESMGAQFVTVDMESEVSSDGYAKEMTEPSRSPATAVMYDEEARAADIVITTALIPGRPAPKLITAETIAGDADRQRDRRHGRGQRRQHRADPHRPGDRHRERRHDHRLHRPGRSAGRADLAALRHQHRQPAQADDPGEGRRARPRPRGRRRPRHHRGAPAASRCGRRPPVQVSAAPSAAPPRRCASRRTEAAADRRGQDRPGAGRDRCVFGLVNATAPRARSRGTSRR